jgi:hypothetical protein
MSDFESFYYDEQLKRYAVQFMAIFANMRVQVGASATQPARLIKVPIVYGSRDRVVASIKGEHTQNKPLRVPTMSAYIRSLEMAPELRKGVAQKRRNVVQPLGGVFPDDVRTVEQYMPVPYKARFELSVYASNTDQHFQIMEQILMIFDPILQIQTSDDPLDWTQITTVELQSVNWEENFPSLADQRMIQSTLNFDTTVYLSAPANLKHNFIAEIKIRLGVVNDAVNLRDSNAVVEALDEEGIPYTDLFSLADINIDKP